MAWPDDNVTARITRSGPEGADGGGGENATATARTWLTRIEDWADRVVAVTTGAELAKALDVKNFAQDAVLGRGGDPQLPYFSTNRNAARLARADHHASRGYYMRVLQNMPSTAAFNDALAALNELESQGMVITPPRGGAVDPNVLEKKAARRKR